LSVGPCYAEKLETDHVGLVNVMAELEAGATGLRPLYRKKIPLSVWRKDSDLVSTASFVWRKDSDLISTASLTLSISDRCPCAIRIRPFELPYGLFLTTQGHESRRGSVRSGTRPTLNSLLPRASVGAFTLKVSRALMSIRVLALNDPPPRRW